MKRRKCHFQRSLIKRREKRKAYSQIEILILYVNKLNRGHLTDLFIERYK